MPGGRTRGARMQGHGCPNPGGRVPIPGKTGARGRFRAETAPLAGPGRGRRAVFESPGGDGGGRAGAVTPETGTCRAGADRPERRKVPVSGRAPGGRRVRRQGRGGAGPAGTAAPWHQAPGKGLPKGACDGILSAIPQQTGVAPADAAARLRRDARKGVTLRIRRGIRTSYKHLPATRGPQPGTVHVAENIARRR